MPLSRGNGSGSVFRLRRLESGAEAECATCAAVIPNSTLHAATLASPQTLRAKHAAKSSNGEAGERRFEWIHTDRPDGPKRGRQV